VQRMQRGRDERMGGDGVWHRRKRAASQWLAHWSHDVQLELGLLGGWLLLAAALLPAVGQRVVHVSISAKHNRWQGTEGDDAEGCSPQTFVAN